MTGLQGAKVKVISAMICAMISLRLISAMRKPRKQNTGTDVRQNTCSTRKSKSSLRVIQLILQREASKSAFLVLWAKTCLNLQEVSRFRMTSWQRLRDCLKEPERFS